MYENERLLRIHGDWCRILSGLSTTESMADINWDYSVLHGPEKWSEHCEIGKKQSPINIETAEVRYDQSLLANPLSMDCRGVYLNVRNLGVNISAAYANKSLNALLLSGGPLRHTYQFREMHLHWGKCADRGSEHRINGKCFSAELHLVHWNRDLYETELEAIKSPLGLCVLGIFLDSSTDAHNESLEQLLRMFEKVEFKDDSYMSDNELIPYSVMPTNTHDYYTYDGSLTTPPCYESVKWIVFANAVPVSQKQLERLRLLKAVGRNDGKGGNFRDPFGTCISYCTCIEPPCIGDNCRPVMEVNERVVLSSCPVLR